MDSLIRYRSFGSAKYEVEYRKRFQPKDQRAAVTESVWEALFGEAHLNLTPSQLRNVEVYYEKYKAHASGYDLLAEKDGR